MSPRCLMNQIPNGFWTDDLKNIAEKSEIRSFFSGKKIFITGATGFLGSVLLEKLLRSCTELEAVYMLIRAKKGQGIKIRMEKMLDSELFCQISPKIRNKIIPVEGNISLPRLGISAEFEDILAKEVQIVFHVAASTNFSSPLRQAMNINFQGTKSIMELMEKMKNLQVLVHISTAYCNAIVRGKIREEVYPSWIDGNDLMEALGKMTDFQIEQNTESLLGGQPNTYAFSKHLSENLLFKKRKSVPVAVVRPSVVLGTWEEPIPGWVENVQNGGVAFIAGAGKGVFRTVIGDKNKITDIVPCDMVANLSIAAAWDVVTEGKGTFKTYHCTSGTDNPINLDTYCKLTIQKVIEYPCKEVIWYPAAKCRMNPSRVFLFLSLYHLLPSLLLHVMEKCNGKNRPIISYQQKFIRGLLYVSYFTKRDWHFDTTNARALAQKLSKADSMMFNFDVTKIHWPTYIERCVLGVRSYYHRDSPKTIEKSRRIMKLLKFIHYMTYILTFTTVACFMFLMGFRISTSLFGALTVWAFFVWL